MVLSGTINKQIVSAINAAGGTAIGVSGKDGNLIQASRFTGAQRDTGSNIERVLDLGYVGEPEKINPQPLIALEQSGMIPVIAPIGFGTGGETYNINADTVAGAIASAIGASRLLMLTDVIGVLDKQGELLTDLTLQQVAELRRDGTISGGMIPKVETCVKAVESGVEAAVILDGRVPHSLLLEIFTDRGIGTIIRRD
jgi:acetylglutamate kinase